MCHPDRSEAEWRDLLFQLFPPDQSQNVYAANFRLRTLAQEQLAKSDMKSDRLLSALMLLHAHRRLSSREIAERLEISQRTAQRDMKALCISCTPLIAHRGAQGGCELQKGWRT